MFFMGGDVLDRFQKTDNRGMAIFVRTECNQVFC